jgi:DNA-binding transcriptional ArsR family regulator
MEVSAKVETIAGQFAALAHPHRIQIVRLLLAVYDLGGMTAGEIQSRLKMPGSTLNHHLMKLERAGLVESRRDRQWVWYAARAKGLREMLNFLFEECCTGNRVLSVEEIAGAKKS